MSGGQLESAFDELSRFQRGSFDQPVAPREPGGSRFGVTNLGGGQQNLCVVRVELSGLVEIRSGFVDRAGLFEESRTGQPGVGIERILIDQSIDKGPGPLLQIEVVLVDVRQAAPRFNPPRRVLDRRFVGLGGRLEIDQHLVAATGQKIELTVGRMRLPQNLDMSQRVCCATQSDRNLNLSAANVLSRRIDSQHIFVNHERVPARFRAESAFVEQHAVIGQCIDVARNEADVLTVKPLRPSDFARLAGRLAQRPQVARVATNLPAVNRVDRTEQDEYDRRKDAQKTKVDDAEADFGNLFPRHRFTGQRDGFGRARLSRLATNGRQLTSISGVNAERVCRRFLAADQPP